MSIRRDPPTAADLIVAALSPILIMGVVGSLVKFLAEVLYAGQYESSLQSTLFWFVGGMVLVGRIAVTVDRGRAWVYGLVLGVATYFALSKWIDIPTASPAYPFKEIINVFLIGVVWWCSNRLVWDCTFIDETRTGSGKGLLAAAGWEKGHDRGDRPDVVDDAREDESRYQTGIQGWYERYADWRKARAKRPHTPGLTVVYFALAALPIFGIGQSLIPAEEEARRSFGFRCAAVYVSCSMGLMLTTAFLGLRRYLRQRRLQMPVAMTAGWMGVGGVLTLVFVAVAALLPRPYSETPVWDVRRFTSSDRNASQYAQNRDGAGKGEGKTGNQTEKGEGDRNAKGGEPGGKGKDGDAKKGSGDKDGKSGSNGDKSNQKGNESKGSKEDGGSSKSDAKGSDRDGNKARDSDSGAKDRRSSSDASQQSSSSSQSLQKIGTVFKWIIYVVVGLVIAFVLFRHGLSFLSNFMPWAKGLLAAIDAWWKGLFGVKEPKRAGGSAESAGAEVQETPTVPFAAFNNPFSDGSAGGRSVESLTRYTFEALEAWAADQAQGRRTDETAVEFAERLGAEHEWLQGDGRRLAALVTRLAYAPGGLPANARTVIRDFWTCLESGPVAVTADD